MLARKIKENVAEQTTISSLEYSNFLQAGAILSQPGNQFKLIWGPFKSNMFDLMAISDLNFQRTYIYKPDFWDFLENKKGSVQLWSGEKEACVSRDELLNLICTFFSEEKLDSIDWQNENWTDFQDQFNWAEMQFKEKELTKVVPITRQQGKVKFSSKRLNEAIKQSIESKPYGFIYGFWQNYEGFFGVTPELIGQWNSVYNVFETMALAGTQRNSVDVECAMLDNFKLMKEHQIVVQDIQQSIKKIKNEINTFQTQVLKLSAFSHLQTLITTATSNLTEAFSIVESIHPSAALGIFPKKNELLKKFSEFDLQKKRCNFAAPFGFLNQDSLNIVAAIRNFFFTKDEISIFSGCGVIQESQVESEIDELRQKRQSVQKMMGFNL